MNKVLFTASLSNGETIYEEKGNFKTIDGALSPWQRLLSYLAEKQVHITSLSLYTNDGRRWNLPSAGNNPKFGELANVQKPIDFVMQRKAAYERMNDSSNGEWGDKYTVAIAYFEDGSQLQVWVAEDTLVSWSILK